jgi:hypothetical protein
MYICQNGYGSHTLLIRAKGMLPFFFKNLSKLVVVVVVGRI